MRIKLPEIEQINVPNGKRRIHWNIYGNWIGYVSGRRWKEFGCGIWAEREANEWLNAVTD